MKSLISATGVLRMASTTAHGSRVDFEKLRFVYIELTVKCNLRCHFCDNEMRNLYHDIPFEQFCRLVDQLQPGTTVGLHGLGEPTLHPRLIEMIARAKERGLRVYFNSNHTVTTEGQMRAFVDLGLDELRISMSAGSRAAYQRYSGRDLLDTLVRRVHQMVEIRGGSRVPLLRIVFVLTKDNRNEFPEVLRRAEAAGVDELQVQTTLDWGKGDGSPAGHECEDQSDRDELVRETQNAIALAARAASRVKVILPFPFDDATEASRAPGQCQWPFNAIWITANGQVTPCCNIHDPRQLSLGSVFDQSIDDVWRSGEYERFRADYRREAVSACLSCPVHYGMFKTYTYESRHAGA